MTTATKRRPKSRTSDPDHQILKFESPPDVPQETPRLWGAFAPTEILVEQEIPLAVLKRHPRNRQPTDESVRATAVSMATDGQIEAVIVRRLGGSTETYQVLSGETRWLAAKSLRWPTLRSRVIEADDAAALRLVAIANAKRRDLNPIERAQLLKALTDPISEGGAGLTQEAAGEDLGIARATVANELRMLRLPEKIREHVAAGRLPATYARELITAADSPAYELIERVVCKIVDDCKPTAKQPDRSVEFEHSRETFVDTVRDAIRDKTRLMTPADERERSNEWGLQHGVDRWFSDRLFEPGDEQLRKLGVFEFAGEKRAVNVQLWKSLQGAAAKELLAKLKAKSDKKANAADRKAAAKKKAETPAQVRARKAEQEKQLAKRIERFRIDWYRYLVSLRLEAGIEGCRDPQERLDFGEVVDRLMLWLTIDHGGERTDSYSARTSKFHQRLDLCFVNPGGERLSDKGSWNGLGILPWAAVCKISDESFDEHRLNYLSNLFFSDGGSHALVDGEIVCDLLKPLRIDPRAAWKSALAGPLTDRFFAMFNREQLVALAREWGITTVESWRSLKVSEIVDRLRNHPGSRKLPKRLNRGAGLKPAKPTRRKP